jgi:hypothetical protein
VRNNDVTIRAQLFPGAANVVGPEIVYRSKGSFRHGWCNGDLTKFQIIEQEKMLAKLSAAPRGGRTSFSTIDNIAETYLTRSGELTTIAARYRSVRSGYFWND